MRVKPEEYFCNHCGHLTMHDYVASVWQHTRNERLYRCEDCQTTLYASILELNTQDAFMKMQDAVNGARESGW